MLSRTIIIMATSKLMVALVEVAHLNLPESAPIYHHRLAARLASVSAPFVESSVELGRAVEQVEASLRTHP